MLWIVVCIVWLICSTCVVVFYSFDNFCGPFHNITDMTEQQWLHSIFWPISLVKQIGKGIKYVFVNWKKILKDL